MLFFEKENVFMCLVAFQKMFWKIFSGIWLCSWKYHRKHIFYLLLTFSWLPNEYIISFLPQYRNTNKTQKKNHQIRSHFLTFSLLPNEYIIPFIPQYKHKQNPEKKSSNPVKLREEGRERGNWVQRGAAIGAVLREIAISAVLCDCGSTFGSMIGLSWKIGGEVSSAWPGVNWIGVSFGGWALFFLSLSLFCAWLGNGLKVKWKSKTISGSKE